MNRLLLRALAGVLLLSAAAYGQGLDEGSEIERLRRTVEEQSRTISDLMGRMEALEGADDSLGSEIESVLASYAEESGGLHLPAEGPSWVDGIALGGDFRYRHEYIDDDRSERDRHRQRIRARVDLTAKVNDEVRFEFQVTTASDEGSNGGDPRSHNQTLTNQWSVKHIWISRACVEYAPAWIDGLAVRLGKVKRPFLDPAKSELIFDSDVTPEGATLRYERAAGSFDLLFHGYGYWTAERGGDADSGLFGAQLVGRGSFEALDDDAHGLLGVSYYDHTNVEHKAPFFVGARGNETSGGELPTDFDLLNLFTEVGVRVSGIPVVVFADFVRNLAARGDDDGWSIGLKIGKAKKPGQVEGRWLYRKLERNAVLGSLADSDFGGGNTSVKGHELNAKVNVAVNWDVGLSLFLNEIGIAGEETEEDYTRLQLDLMFEF